tara:strand:+ start:55 stop:642 length:588 start_codon:yes stop_codon:yes gene_type:complete
MTDKKDEKSNVVIGPWGETPIENNGEWIKEKYNKALDNNNTTLKMQEKLARVDIITENIMVQLIHTLSENNYDIADENFILDIGFLSETIKGVISRQEKIPHIIQGLIDNIMAPDETKTQDGVDLHFSRFDAPLMADLVDMAEEIKEHDTEILVDFESDSELQEQIDLDEKEDKGSLHELRNKKINKDDEDKDKD